MVIAKSNDIDWSGLRKILDERCNVWWRALQETGPLDRSVTEQAIHELYRAINLPTPLILWCQSPWQACAASVVLRKQMKPDDLEDSPDSHLFMSGKYTSLWKAMWQHISPQLTEQYRQCLVKQDTPEDLEDDNRNGWTRIDPPFVEQYRFDRSFKTDMIEQLRMGIERDFGLALNIRFRRQRAYSNLQEYYRHEFGALSRQRFFRMLQVDAESMARVLRARWNWGPTDLIAPEVVPRELLPTDAPDSWTEKKGDDPVCDFACAVYAAQASYFKQLVLDAAWLPFWECLFEQLSGLTLSPLTVECFQAIFQLIRQTMFCVFLDPIVFVCERPSVYRLDDMGHLHCEDGPALAFEDGYKLYSIHGTMLPEKVVESPELITVGEIIGTFNVEVRRVMIQRYGMSKFMENSGAELVSEDECGVLYRKRLQHDEPLMMVKVINSTPEPDGSIKEYFLRVPPTMQTAREAVAWTFGYEAKEYSPRQET